MHLYVCAHLGSIHPLWIYMNGFQHSVECAPGFRKKNILLNLSSDAFIPILIPSVVVYGSENIEDGCCIVLLHKMPWVRIPAPEAVFFFSVLLLPLACWFCGGGGPYHRVWRMPGTEG